MSEGKKEVSVLIKAIDETVAGFKSARHSVSEFASEAKTMIAEAFAGFTVFEFFKGAIEKATEAEQSYAQLSNTLANVGVSYEKNREHIEATIKSLQKVANVRTDDAIKGFNTLVQRSGDYDASLKNMVLTADLAKAKHLEFNDAAELVGRVMGGNTRVLKQFGIVTKDAHEGLKLLQERIGGAAATDMATFGGQVEAVKIKFYNLLEAFGDVLTGSTTLGGSMSDLRGGLEHLTEWVEKNRASMGFWFSAIVAGVELIVTNFRAAISTAFSLGKVIGDVLSLSWGHAGDAEKRKALFADIEAQQHSMIAAGRDAANSVGAFTDALALAGQREESIRAESDERLKANAARNAAERQAAKDKEDEKAAAEAKKKQDEIDRAVAQRLQVATKLAEASATEAVGLAQLRLIERAATEALKDGNLSWERRAMLLERVNAAHAARVKVHDPELDPTALELMNRGNQRQLAAADRDVPTADQARSTTNADAERLKAEFARGFKDGDLGKAPQITFMDALGKKWDDHRKQLVETGAAYKSFGQVLADTVSGPIAQFGESTAMAMGAMIVGSQNAGQAFKSAMIGALSSVAKIEGDHFAGLAIADLAVHDYWAAGRHAAAATAMYAVSGAASALGGGGGGGAGGGSALSTSTSLANAAAPGKLTVMWPGRNRSVLDITDPSDQQAVQDMLMKLAGNREIVFQFAGG
jgi:hypothetical protein